VAAWTFLNATLYIHCLPCYALAFFTIMWEMTFYNHSKRDIVVQFSVF
jgi:hypothetical protein